jgi:hypothetical protein
MGLLALFALTQLSWAQFSFYLIDNFEDGNYNEGTKWWHFGDLKMEVVKNPSLEARDLIAESCGVYALNLKGETRDWYIGGIGTYLGIDASPYSRLQIDVSGDGLNSGRLVIELYDDDNGNYAIEKDAKTHLPLCDDKWVAEINILGKGFTRYSIPFTAFHCVNPGIGDGLWNPDQLRGSGGLVEMQLIAIADRQAGKVDLKIDNLILTY